VRTQRKGVRIVILVYRPAKYALTSVAPCPLRNFTMCSKWRDDNLTTAAGVWLRRRVPVRQDL
jgi:hypothetical protein